MKLSKLINELKAIAYQTSGKYGDPEVVTWQPETDRLEQISGVTWFATNDGQIGITVRPAEEKNQ